jgi:hypothetical protein
MKKLLGIVIVLMVVLVPLYCQDTPKAEVFGGYQLTHISYGLNSVTGVPFPGANTSDNFNGWNGALTVWAKPWLGVTADFSGAYKSDVFGSGSGVSVKQHTFMFGPTIASHSNEKFVPFAHVLVGGAHCSASGVGVVSSDCFGVGTNSFAMAFGGGLDVGSKKIAFRVAQFDYIYTRFGHDQGFDHQNDLRYSAGIVFRF